MTAQVLFGELVRPGSVLEVSLKEGTAESGFL